MGDEGKRFRRRYPLYLPHIFTSPREEDTTYALWIFIHLFA